MKLGHSFNTRPGVGWWRGGGFVWQNTADWESNGRDYRLPPPVGAAWETGGDRLQNEVNEMVRVDDQETIIGIKKQQEATTDSFHFISVHVVTHTK